MSWAEIKRAVNSYLNVPLNALEYANDFHMYGRQSYVYKNSDIWQTLLSCYLVSMNDEMINKIVLDEITNINTGKAFAAVDDIDYSFNNITTWNDLTSSEEAMTAVAASSTAMTAVAASSTAMTAINTSDIAIGKYAASLAGLNPADYANMTAVAASSTAMTAVAASSTAMTAVAASSTAMTAVAKSALALNSICSSAVAASAVATSIQSYRNNILSTLGNSSSTYFTYSTTTVGDGSGIACYDSGNNILIPYSCYDDGDTTYTAYYGYNNTSRVIVPTIASHSSTSLVTVGVSLRGVTVVGSGASVGNMGFYVYTAV